jgi:hypothetical protein
MSRGVVVAVALAVAAAGPAEARTAKPAATKTTATKKKPAAKKKPAKRVAKAKKLGKPSKRSKLTKGLAKGSKKPKPRVKTTAKPLVKVAALQSDGRVKYGPDHLPPGFAWPPTKQMLDVSKSCEAELDNLGIHWKPAPGEHMVVDPVIVPSMQIGGITYTSAFRRKGAPTMDCQFVRVLALLGPELHAIGVREVQFGSIVRNTLARSHGQTKDFLSRHALGIAMDIRSFVDANGRVATVETDYLKDDPLLHGIEELINSRTTFRQVLTPGNDPISHDDHFHIEASVDFTTFR